MTRPLYNPGFTMLIGLLSWVLPGLGHIAIKQYTRGIIIMLCVCGLFILGLYIGSIGVIDPVGAPLWYAGQTLTSPAVMVIAEYTKPQNRIWPYPSYARPFDTGQIYTSIAGALNLLCIINAMYVAYTGKQQSGGDENA
jgi:TM2 domain-containing membrane protein YozV